MEGIRLLDKLVNYPVRPGWYTKVAQQLATDIRNLLLKGNAVLSGGVAAVGGTVSASVLQVTTTGALSAKLNGALKASLAAITDTDLFTTAGSVGQAIFEDGSSAAAISLATSETAQVTLVAVDSTGAGAATGDNGAALYVAVVAGVGGAGKTYQTKTAPLTNAQIRAALMASTGVHAGTTGFVRLADFEWDEGGGSPAATVTVNRDA